jgi:nucleoid-associated protein YgaU
MRTLLALTTLMLVLAGAVWWKTRPAENTNQMPPTTSQDTRVGIATVGLEGSRPVEASFPTGPKTDGGGDHELPAKTSSNTDSEETTSATPKPVKELPVDTPPVTPTPPVVAAVLEYTVVSGDSLYGIVRRAYGSAPERLIDAVATANHMDDPSSLNLGQVLRLPIIEGFPAPQKP